MYLIKCQFPLSVVLEGETFLGVSHNENGSEEYLWVNEEYASLLNEDDAISIHDKINSKQLKPTYGGLPIDQFILSLDEYQVPAY